jgi:hypothetical protein
MYRVCREKERLNMSTIQPDDSKTSGSQSKNGPIPSEAPSLPPIALKVSMVGIGTKSESSGSVLSSKFSHVGAKTTTLTAADLQKVRERLSSLSKDFVAERWQAGDADSYCSMMLDGKLVYLGNNEQMEKLVENNPELKEQIDEAKEKMRLVFGHMRTNQTVGGDQAQLNAIVAVSNNGTDLFTMPVGASQAFIDTMGTSYLGAAGAAIVTSHATTGIVTHKMTEDLAGVFYTGAVFTSSQSEKESIKADDPNQGGSQSGGTVFVDKNVIRGSVKAESKFTVRGGKTQGVEKSDDASATEKKEEKKRKEVEDKKLHLRRQNRIRAGKEQKKME